MKPGKYGTYGKQFREAVGKLAAKYKDSREFTKTILQEGEKNKSYTGLPLDSIGRFIATPNVNVQTYSSYLKWLSGIDTYLKIKETAN